jgi:uncharacterized FlaG/YvyC family protein
MKCKCGKEFEPIRRNGIIVSKLCISCIIEKSRANKKKEWNKEKKKIKESLKTKSDYLNELQKSFNTFIRVRDKDKPCISCKRPLTNKYDAGHYFSVGAYPNLRFNELNVHGQCVHCNRDLHGNISEYSIALPERIGIASFEKLKRERNTTLQLTIEEVKELIKIYKKKIKEFNKNKIK